MFSDIPILGLSKDQIELNRRDIMFMAWLHEWASKNRVSLVCQRCDHAIIGQNTGHEKHPAVACQCREFRYVGTDL